MELKPCPDCTQPISQKAAFCPHCGCPGHNAYAQPVTVNDLDIGFGTMVGLLVKIVIAAIPAGILLTVIGLLIFGLMTGAIHR